MPRDPRYDILFEPIRIGPVTAKNRFYQVPHCTGMGYMLPQTLTAMRAVKAEGGWGVVCTEYCSIHPTADDAPYPLCTLWDEDDVPVMAAMADAIHAHGALAGTELWHGGSFVTNKLSRAVGLSPSGGPISYLIPQQTRAMDKEDIRALRRWHRDAALRAKAADFDLVYVYAGHAYLPFQFISQRYNQRTDEYGGSLENRVRLVRELIEDTKAAIGDRCAVAVRFAVDELMGPTGLTSDGEGREVVEMLAELPDLWDVNISDTANDSGTSRFFPEASQEIYTGWVKSVTTKPVVGVGRFTSPDTMAGQLRRGILDLIGAARPSIADPFLPRKIEEGRTDDIRECIGCNICRAANKGAVPLRCTQNPTMGEEWRRGWHPERIARRGSGDSVLVVGAGPAGLECARALGERGYDVHLAEATDRLGGHVSAVATLPGLGAWARVRDYRLQQIGKMANVQVYRDSRLTAEDVRSFGFAHVAVATGSLWRRDGVGRQNAFPIAGIDRDNVLAPDDVLLGAAVTSPVVIFDDEHYYMAGALAERLRLQGHDVTLVTPQVEACAWARWTDEQRFVETHLLKLGVKIVTHHNLASRAGQEVDIQSTLTGEQRRLPCATLIPVTSRLPRDGLYRDLVCDAEALRASGIKSVTRIGDCLAPGLIVDAVYSGHGYARALDEPPAPDVPYKRERPVVAARRT